ncbi:MAG: hypothetical protein CL607_14455 [Anaerolineaceae bacterium]|nr:hypothetical protein [Anaerolineaceae bacterium]
MQARLYKQDIIVIALVLLGFGLRLYTIGNLPFRGDEAFTVQNWVMQPLSTTFNEIIVIDPHPPLAYTAFHIWGGLVGTSEVAIRLLPALANTIGIAAMYALGRQIGNRWVGVLAALLWAVHPFEIYHAQDARNYGIWPALSVTSLWLALKALRRNRPIDWGLYAVAATLSMFIYYLELFVLAALNLYVIITYWRNRHVLKRWISIQVFLGVLFAIWVAFFSTVLARQEMYGGTADKTQFEAIFTLFFPSWAFGQSLILPPEQMLLLGIVLCLLVIGLLTFVTSKDRKQGLLLALLIVVPLTALSIVALRLSVFRPRYIMGVVPAILLALSLTSVYLYRRGTLAKAGVIVLLAGWFGISAISLNNYYHDPAYAKSHEWPVLADYIAHNIQDADLIVLQSNDAAFGYYYHQTDAAALDIAKPETSDETAEELETTVSSLLTEDARLWLVSTPIPGWSNRNVIRDWALRNMQLSLETSPGGVPIQLFLPWDVSDDEVNGSARTQLGDIAEVVDVHVFPPEGNDTITVWVYWRALETSEAAYKGFVHLTGAFNEATGGPLWSQDDHLPQDGGISTTIWEPGTLYRDIYRVPVGDVPAGTYQLIVGMYEETTGDRLTTPDGADAYLIQSISLEQK